jgi:hypothetical protein
MIETDGDWELNSMRKESAEQILSAIDVRDFPADHLFIEFGLWK